MIYKIAVPVLISLFIHIRVRLWRVAVNEELNKMANDFLNSALSESLWWSADYFVVMNFEKGAGTSKSRVARYDVTLVTQCSVNNLRYLPEMAARWRGPLSVAVFIPSTDALKGMLALRWLRSCYPSTFANTQFHLVYPHTSEPALSDETMELMFFNNENFCQQAKNIIEQYEGTNYARGGIDYPHNTLRNVARKAVNTTLFFMVDVDTFPSVGLRENFLQFFTKQRRENQKTLYIVPAFEIKEDFAAPGRKSQLVEQFNKGIVRTFHSETCKSCHEATRFEEWLSLSQNSLSPVAFETNWSESWEPFYISDLNVPMHDEGFRQYGFDRISQVCETYIAGYSYLVLNNAFVVHKGFKRFHEFHSEKSKENKKNFKYYTQVFLPRLKSKYNSSRRSCVEENKRIGKSQVRFRPQT